MLSILGKMCVLIDSGVDQVWLLTRCSILIILSVLSFNPQLQRLQKHGESTGISRFYILFNLVVATEQFTVGLFLIGFGLGGSKMLDSPPLFGEWLNLVQFGAVWLCHLVL
jgi:hypothetical protein